MSSILLPNRPPFDQFEAVVYKGYVGLFVPDDAWNRLTNHERYVLSVGTMMMGPTPTTGLFLIYDEDTALITAEIMLYLASDPPYAAYIAWVHLDASSDQPDVLSYAASFRGPHRPEKLKDFVDDWLELFEDEDNEQVDDDTIVFPFDRQPEGGDHAA